MSVQVRGRKRLHVGSDLVEALNQMGWQKSGGHESGAAGRVIVHRFANMSFGRRLGLDATDDLWPQIVVSNRLASLNTFDVRLGLLDVTKNPAEEFTANPAEPVSINSAFEPATMQSSILGLYEEFKNLYESREVMMGKTIDTKARNAMAQKAAHLRIRRDGDYTVGYSDLYTVLEGETVPTNLWALFLLIRHNLLEGNFILKRKDGVERKSEKVGRKARPIQDIIEQVRLNATLWEIAASV